MIAPGVFHRWVPNALRIPVLLLLFFVPLNLNGVYPGNTTDLYSDLGIYTETYIAAYNAIYIGMGLGFIIHMRLAARFSVKTLVLYGLTAQFFMSAACVICPYPGLIILACFLLGFCKVCALKELYSLWAAIWSKEGDRGRIYPFVFSMALAGSYAFIWVMAELAFRYNWQYAYVLVLGIMLVAILLVLLLFEHHPPLHPLPLYQMDWMGVLLLASFMMLVNYVSVYGQVEDWFNSPSICFAFVLMPLFGLGFLLRESIVKRPALPLFLLRVRNYVPGLVLFLISGINVPVIIQYLYAQQVLKFELTSTLSLNLYLIPGVLMGAILSGIWYRLKWPPLLLICLGMLTCLLYNVLFYHQVTGAEGYQDFRLPSVLKGMGLVILYISLGIQTTKWMPPKYAITALGFMIIFRSFLARGLFNSGFIYLLYAGRVRHLSSVAEGLDPAWQYRFSGGAYFAFMQRQAFLGAASELTGWIIWMGGAVILGLLAFLFMRGVFRRC
jgi:MFS transporter, DHA2 family, multidrug resistance protein